MNRCKMSYNKDKLVLFFFPYESLRAIRRLLTVHAKKLIKTKIVSVFRPAVVKGLNKFVLYFIFQVLTMTAAEVHQGVCHEIFDLHFVYDSKTFGPLINRLNYFRFRFRFRRDIRSQSCLRGVLHTVETISAVCIIPHLSGVQHFIHHIFSFMIR